jgi:predicted nuclease of predicted toxin-antitoxin system
MRFLADENIPRSIVRWLRSEGHDVLYAAETRAQAPDADLLNEAEAQSLVLITEDKDFGELVFRGRLNSHGVVLLRMGDFPVSFRLARLQAVWTTIEGNLPGNFLVLTESKLRVRSLAPPP